MTFCNFRDAFNLFHDSLVGVSVVKDNPDKSAYSKTKRVGFHDKTGTFDNTGIFHLFHALVDGGSGYAAFPGYFQKGNSCIFYKMRQDLAIDVIDLIFYTHYFLFTC